jgi:hypothetical protein
MMVRALEGERVTEREDDVWNKVTVPTLNTLLEALLEVRRRE